MYIHAHAYIRTYLCLYIHKLQKGALHSLRQEVSLSLSLSLCMCAREGRRHRESGSKRVVAGSIKKEAWANSWTLLINNNNALLSHFPCSLMRLCICMNVWVSVCACTLIPAFQVIIVQHWAIYSHTHSHTHTYQKQCGFLLLLIPYFLEYEQKETGKRDNSHWRNIWKCRLFCLLLCAYTQLLWLKLQLHM